jgi:hypothetical protein
MMAPQQQQQSQSQPCTQPQSQSHSTTATQLQQQQQQQQRQCLPPVFNGVNHLYPGLQQFHMDPPVFGVYNFLTFQECQFLIDAASDSFCPAPVVGKGSGEVSPTRTSSTCYLAREDLPDLMRKVSMLTGKPIEHMELPQGKGCGGLLWWWWVVVPMTGRKPREMFDSAWQSCLIVLFCFLSCRMFFGG